MHNLYNIRYAFRIELEQKIESEVKIKFPNSHDLRTNHKQPKTNLEGHIWSFSLKLTFSFPAGLECTGRKGLNFVRNPKFAL